MSNIPHIISMWDYFKSSH